MGASRKPSIRKLRRVADKHNGRADSLRRCGRPTKDGQPCGCILQWYEFACSTHATPPEQDAALDLLRAAEQRGAAR